MKFIINLLSLWWRYLCLRFYSFYCPAYTPNSGISATSLYKSLRHLFSPASTLRKSPTKQEIKSESLMSTRKSSPKQLSAIRHPPCKSSAKKVKFCTSSTPLSSSWARRWVTFQSRQGWSPTAGCCQWPSTKNSSLYPKSILLTKRKVLNLWTTNWGRTFP